MTDIVLIQPPFADFYSTPQRTYPLGLLYIGAALQQAGFSVTVLNAGAGDKKRSIPLPARFAYLQDHYREDRSPFALFQNYYYFGQSLEDIVEAVFELSPRLVGISLLTTAYSNTAMQLARALKGRMPDLPLFGGGHHATHFPEASLEVFDYIIRGEGEKAAVQLADLLLNGKGGSEIQGLCRTEGDHPLIGEPAWLPAGMLADLRPARDLVPIPDLHGLPGMPVLTSRGCPLACSYCCTGRELSGGFRPRPAAQVLSEVESGLRDHGVRHVNFEDENFTWDRERALIILKGLADLRSRIDFKMSAMNGLLPETLDQEMIMALAAAGFEELNCSLGSVSPDILAKYHRPVNLAASFERAAGLARTAGLRTIAYTISGGPHAAVGDILKDILFLARTPARLGLSTYYPAPGSPDLQSNACPAPEDFEMYRASVYPIEGIMNRSQMITASRLSRLVNFMKTLPARGIKRLLPADLLQEGARVIPEEIDRLAVTALHTCRLPGLNRDRHVYWHTADDDMVQACMTGLRDQGFIESFSGKLDL